jgi:hypothetical protein
MAGAYTLLGKETGRLAAQAKMEGTGAKPSFFLFSLLGILALFKDMLDLIGLGSLPGIGTIVTAGFSLTMFLLLLVFDRSGGRANRRMMQGLIVTAGGLIEGLGFIINFLPLQTLTVIFLYLVARRSWKRAHKETA